MIITHETTIEEYEAWLAKEPRFNDFKTAVQKTFRLLYRTLSSLSRRLRKRNQRSCLAPMAVVTIYPLCYAKNDSNRTRKYHQWLGGVRKSLDEVQEHIRRIDMFDCLEGKTWAGPLLAERQERIARVEDELAMERLKYQALEILTSCRK